MINLPDYQAQAMEVERTNCLICLCHPDCEECQTVVFEDGNLTYLCDCSRPDGSVECRCQFGTLVSCDDIHEGCVLSVGCPSTDCGRGYRATRSSTQ